MKFYAITENHLYRKAYKNGKRTSTRSISVYVLRDRHAALLKKQNPEKKTLNRIGISASKKSGALCSGTAQNASSEKPTAR